MVCHSEDLLGSGMDLRGVQRRFESRGWRQMRVSSRLGLPFVKASGQLAHPPAQAALFVPCMIFDFCDNSLVFRARW